MKFVECSIDTLQEQARLLARRVSCPSCIFLYGAMGSGKTTFAKSFIREFCDDESISVISPTFTIIQTYTNANVKDFAYGEIWHIDLYRIKSFAEVTELGLEEVLFRNICIIEWPEQIEYLRVPNKISVYLNIMSASTRALSIRYK